jgi:hypothetical protein
LKIKNNNYWEIDRNYIPPSCALNAVEILLQKFVEIKKLIIKILDKFPEKNPFQIHLDLLKLELNDFTPNKSPEEWYLLMKKFCWLFYKHLKNEKNFEENYKMKCFIEELFNPFEIDKGLQLGLEYFKEVDSIFDVKPVKEVDEFEIKL